MLKILTNVPLFVWPLFVLLLVGGVKARKRSAVPLAVLLLVPVLFFVWSLSSFFGRYAADVGITVLWALCVGAGFLVGFLHLQRIELQFNREKKLVEMPGSWIPLMLSMSIFAAKFSLGMLRGMCPHLEGSMLFLGLELFSALILGIFAGRGISCLVKYRSSASVA